MDDDFSFLQPLDLITKDPYELQRIIKAKKENLQKDRLEENGKHNEDTQVNELEHTQEREEKKGREKEQELGKETIEKDRELEKGKEKEKAHQDHIINGEKCEDKFVMEYEENGTLGGDLPLLLLLLFYLQNYVVILKVCMALQPPI